MLDWAGDKNFKNLQVFQTEPLRVWSKEPSGVSGIASCGEGKTSGEGRKKTKEREVEWGLNWAEGVRLGANGFGWRGVRVQDIGNEIGSGHG